jgi:hypothetical protein
MLIMQLLNHGIPDALLDRVKELFKEYYKNSMDAEFQKSEIVGMLESAVSQGKNFSTTKIDADWETGFFLQDETYDTLSPPLPTNLKYNNSLLPVY